FQISEAFCSAGEKRTGGGCKESGSAYMYEHYPITHADGREGWHCSSGSTGTLAQSYAICCTASGVTSSGASVSTGDIATGSSVSIDASQINQIQIHVTATSSGDAFNGSATIAKDKNGTWHAAIAGGSSSRVHGQVTTSGLCTSSGTMTSVFTGGMCVQLVNSTSILIKLGSSVAASYIAF
ncbi:MAG: hypothetical protein R3A80_13950, partial [Bdellovibrionota bacterium]